MFRPGKISETGHEGRCRNGDAQIGGPATSFDGRAAAGEVKASRSFAGEGDCKIRNHCALAGRQNYGDSLVAEIPGQHATQGRGRAEKLSAAERTAIQTIGDGS